MLYNKEQQLAIQSIESNIVIIAPPGSGKTHTMIGAINNYMNHNRNDKVVAITFTNKAADEIKNRLFFKNDKINIATIHSWSFTELRKLSKKFNFKIKLLEEKEIKNILLKFMSHYYIKSNYINLIYNYIMGNFNIDLKQEFKNKIIAINKKYIEFKRKRHLYDYTDLPLYLYNKLIDYDHYIEDIDAIFVDEFQDVDPVQLKVFNRLKVKKRFYIGDPDQAIYIFRGAQSEVFYELDDFSKIKLLTNYRSKQEILDYATTFRKFALNKLRKGSHHSNLIIYDIENSHIRAIRGRGATVVVEQNKRLEVISGYVDEINIKSFILSELDKYKPRILCRSNKEVKEISKFYNNVTTVHQAKGLEYDNVIIINFPASTLEEINIAYVAMTRAKDRLIILNCSTLLEVLEKNMKTQIKLF